MVEAESQVIRRSTASVAGSSLGEDPVMKFRHAPSVFPSRHRFNYDVAIPDRQLWAIGMIAAQWGMVEFTVRMHTLKLCGNDNAIKVQYDAQPDFSTMSKIWQTLVEEKITAQPQRAVVL